ncbi:MAG: hypothetical protein M0001_06040, partial [Treponema sp.]|nr:hypothetical protein [Treponema sp.]
MAARPDTAHDGKSNRPPARRDDLERYGVWVKAEPQDIALEPESPEAGDTAGGESFLTEEEEELLGSFDDIDADKGSDGATLKGEEGDDLFETLPEIEDFDAGFLSEQGGESEAFSPGAKAASGAPADLDSPEDLEFELSMEDLSSGFAEEHISPQTPIDMSSIQGLEDEDLSEEFSSLPDIDIPEEVEDFETLPEGAPKKPAMAASSSPELEDVSNEFLDEEFSPAPASTASDSSLRDVTDEFLDLDSPSVPEAESKKSAEPDFDPLDIELHFEDDHLESSPHDHAASGFEEVGELDGFLDAEEKTETFDDMAALEKELGDEASMDRTAPPPHSGQGHEGGSSDSGLANELLLKIANELSSIRSELVTLKSQLSASRLVEQPRPGEATEPEVTEEEGAGGGFFDEEDDEKIALTGDELDNILNSADFTEEPAAEDRSGGAGAIPGMDATALEEAIAPEFETTAPEEEEILDENILPESGEYEAAEPAVELITLDDAQPPAQADGLAALEPAAATTIDDELIVRLAEEGIPQLTPPPEDTSYLEEPLETEGLIDIPETPMVEAPLVEPDLSELALDLGSEDEELEVSGELAVEDAGELPDITLGLDSVAIPERPEEAVSLEAEPLPEFEEDLSFGDIDLATESIVDEVPSMAEESIEELGEFDIEEPPMDELLHEDRGLGPAASHDEESFDLTPEDSIESIELDSELFVPSPSEEAPEDISLSSLPEDEGVEELVLDEETEPFIEEVPLEALEGPELGDIEVEEPATIEVEEPPAFEEPRPAAPAAVAPSAATASGASPAAGVTPAAGATPAAAADPTEKLKSDIRSVLSYLDRLLESLPED